MNFSTVQLSTTKGGHTRERLNLLETVCKIKWFQRISIPRKESVQPPEIVAMSAYSANHSEMKDRMWAQTVTCTR